MGDWSSDVCSSDLTKYAEVVTLDRVRTYLAGLNKT